MAKVARENRCLHTVLRVPRLHFDAGQLHGGGQGGFVVQRRTLEWAEPKVLAIGEDGSRAFEHWPR